MTSLKNALGLRILGTTLEGWVVAVALALGVTIALVAARRFALGRAQRWAARTETTIDDLLVGALGSLRFLFFLAIGLWIAVEYQNASATVRRWARTGVSLLTLVQIGLSVQAVIRIASKRWARAEVDGEARTAASAAVFATSLAVWTLLVMTGLSFVGFEISALVAGLGVGGVAAALAVQNILGDLFSSLSIYFDRPFNIGDFIVVGEDRGTVERIGLRTTRVRSLGGEEIVFANGDLTKSRLRNFKRMQERRVVFGFGVEYDTPLEQLREIPHLVEAIVASQAGTRFDRAHFKEFGDFSLNFEVVYYVLSSEYNVFMDRQQAINLELFARFASRGIRFAFPTQTLLLVHEGKPSSGCRL